MKRIMNNIEIEIFKCVDCESFIYKIFTNVDRIVRCEKCAVAKYKKEVQFEVKYKHKHNMINFNQLV